MNEIILKTKNISKIYGEKTALENVSFTVKKGRIYGFIGENGAGKTTSIRAITGLTYVTDGTVELFGASDRKGLEKARRRMGCLVERPILSLNESAFANLKMQQRLFGLNDDNKINAILDRVGLGDVKHKKAKDFSLGMKQRLGIAIALINDPELLILDEPVNGLDPMGMVDIRELLRSLCEDDGITILISSHILAELYHLATDYIIISHGRVVEEISRKELDRRCSAHVLVETESADKAVNILKECGTEHIEQEGNKLRIYGDMPIRSIAEKLFSAGILVTMLTQVEKSLEEYYMELLGRKLS